MTTTLSGDAVHLFTFTASSITKGSTLNVSLAGEIDLMVRGMQAGDVFATSVSSSTDVASVQRVLLSGIGAATAKGTVCTFGTDTKALTQGLAVQR